MDPDDFDDDDYSPRARRAREAEETDRYLAQSIDVARMDAEREAWDAECRAKRLEHERQYPDEKHPTNKYDQRTEEYRED